MTILLKINNEEKQYFFNLNKFAGVMNFFIVGECLDAPYQTYNQIDQQNQNWTRNSRKGANSNIFNTHAAADPGFL